MTGDPLERLNTGVAGEMFRKPLAKALNCSDRSQGGRPPCDAGDVKDPGDTGTLRPVG